MQRRPWKDRLARNCEELHGSHAVQFYEVNGSLRETDAEAFLLWVGLKATTTGLKRAKSVIANFLKMIEED